MFSKIEMNNIPGWSDEVFGSGYDVPHISHEEIFQIRELPHATYLHQAPVDKVDDKKAVETIMMVENEGEGQLTKSETTISAIELKTSQSDEKPASERAEKSIKRKADSEVERSAKKVMTETEIIEICGLYHGRDGRSCEDHCNCGQGVVVGNLLRLKYITVPIECGIMQQRVAAFLLNDMHEETCMVGFLKPWIYENAFKYNALPRFVGKIIQIISFGRDTKCLDEYQYDLLYGGTAHCVFYETMKPDERKKISVVYNIDS